jgi:hypothetical protein
MTMALYRLIKNIIPTFADKQLRAMVPWFRQISEAVDGVETLFKAGGRMTAGGTWDDSGDSRQGFVTSVNHSGDGLYIMTLSSPLDGADSPYNYLVNATLLNMNIGDPALITIGAQFISNNEVSVRIIQIESGETTEVTGLDHDFNIIVQRMPANPATA